jgi:hypothetical protein
MWRGLLLISTLLVAACAPIPPSPQDIQARRFEAVPGKSVIYLVRDTPDLSGRPAAITLDDDLLITTYQGTFFRWEVPPGTHRISGYASDPGTITLQTEPGRIYFVQQRMTPFSRTPFSRFELIDERAGRAVVSRSVHLAGR